MRLPFLPRLVAPSLLLACLAPSLLPAQTSSSMMTLSALRDRARPLLIFVPTTNDPRLQRQLRLLNENVTAITDRDVIVITLPYKGASPSSTTLSEDDAKAARKRLRVAPSDFTVILIGKDGGEKLRSHTPLSIARLNTTIDAMPMRQQEMNAPRGEHRN